MTEARPKRALFISHFFPPHSAIGALRVGKLARYLDDRSWDVRAIAAILPIPKTMSLEISAAKVVYTAWTDVDRSLERLLGERFQRLVRQQSPLAETNDGGRQNGHAAGAAPSTLRNLLRQAYLELVRLPDNRAGWLRPATAAGEQLFKTWRPDVIYATSPPVTSLIVADRLSRRYDVPWVAEFRDPWIENPYYEYSALRLSIERLWERRVLSRAAAIVSVSPSWQKSLIERHGRPTLLAMNGFVESDFPSKPPLKPSTQGKVCILYTGHIYVGRRDPTPLFEALKLLGADASKVVLEFIGTQVEAIQPLASQYGLSGLIVIVPQVPYREALARQLEADVLLHLQWCDPKEEGTIAGKIFEYIGARRPVLGIGLETSTVAELIRSRNAGIMTNNPHKIAEQLRNWIREKSEGGIAPLPATASQGLDRDRQFERIEKLLLGVVHAQNSEGEPRRARRRPKDPVGFTVTRTHQRASPSLIAKPTLMILIDVEEEFDWTKPFSRDNISVKALERLPTAHALFRKHRLVPTYLVDYPIINSPIGARMFREWRERGECIVGTQLHPWVSPPFEEEIGESNSYPGNLPQQLERAKLKVLTEKIEETCGARPIIYRAGRAGLGPNSIETLEALGYQIDTSVVPHTDYRHQLGPNYAGYSRDTFWFGHGRRMLELPLTRGFTGPLRGLGPLINERLGYGLGGALRAQGILARLGLLQRVTLTPEGITLSEMKRLTEESLADGQKLFAFSFHSPSLLPGSTPYVKSEAAATEFLEKIDSYLDYFLNRLNGRVLTPLDVYKQLEAESGSETDSHTAKYPAPDHLHNRQQPTKWINDEN